MWITVKQTIPDHVYGDGTPEHTFEHHVLFEKNHLYGSENLTQPFSSASLRVFFQSLISQKQGSIVSERGDIIAWEHDEEKG